MKLSEKQQVFSQNVAKLIAKVYEMGLGCTLGECYRPPAMAEIYAKQGIGIKNSVHCQRLALDLYLWKDGTCIMDGPEYGYVAAFWLGLDPLNRWGGRWTKYRDLYHFSMEHEGVA